MGLLGDFLESVFSEGDKYRTLRAKIQFWLDENRSEIASGGNRRQIGLRKIVTGASRTICEGETCVWIGGHDRVRVECISSSGGESHSTLKIVNGEQSWKRDNQGHVLIGEGTRRAPALTEVDRHFEPKLLREFCKDLGLKEQGSIRTADRDCVRLRAVLREGESLWPHWLPAGADEYEFHGDLERGVLLAIFARHGGSLLKSNVVTEIAFDEPLNEALFRYEPGVGEQVASAPPIIEHLSLQAAIARVPFNILLPSPIPDAEHTQLQCNYSPPRGPSGSGRHTLTVFFFNPESRRSLWITESDTPDPEDSDYEWEEIEAQGQKVRLSDPGEAGLRLVSLEKEGTQAQICTNMKSREAVELAVSLTRTSAASPL